MYENLSKLKFSDKITLRLELLEKRLTAIENRLDGKDELDTMHSDGLTRLNREILELRSIIKEAILEAGSEYDAAQLVIMNDKKKLLMQYQKNLNLLKTELAKRGGFDISIQNKINDTEKAISEIKAEIKSF